MKDGIDIRAGYFDKLEAGDSDVGDST